jgi:hypothetical protein
MYLTDGLSGSRLESFVLVAANVRQRLCWRWQNRYVARAGRASCQDVTHTTTAPLGLRHTLARPVDGAATGISGRDRLVSILWRRA